MRLQFEPNVTAFPLVENETLDEVTVAADFQTLLKNGIAAAQSGDRELARTLLVKAAAYEPRSEDAWMWLASISEYPEELLAFLNNVLNINPENERALEWRAATKSLLATTLVGRGVSAHSEGNDALASQCFEQALVHDSECEMAWFWKASLAEDEDHQAEFLNKVLSLNPENSDAQRALTALRRQHSVEVVEEAKAAAVAGDSARALEMLDEALSVSPDIADGWVLRSHLATNMQEKLDALAKALDLAPDNAAARSSYDFLASTVSPAHAPEEAVQETVDEASQPVDFAPEPESDTAVAVAEFEESSEPAPEPDKVEAVFEQVEAAFSEPAPEFPAVSDIEPAPEFELGSETNQEPAASPITAEDYAYTQTVTFQAEPEVESVDKDEEVAAAFADATTEESVPFSPSDPIHVTEEPVEAPRSVEELYGPVEDQIEADRETEDSLSPWDEFAAETVGGSAAHAAETDEQPATQNAPAKEFASELPAITPPTTAPCPYCWEPNEPQAFECASCNATLTLSDIESLLSNNPGNHDVIKNAVTQMEAEWNLREFDQKEMTALAVGHFNLQNFETAMRYLGEASRLNPNDVILAGQMNTLAIRLEEMRRQSEIHESMPRGKTILVVDDSPTVRKLISGKLEKAGHAVVCAEDGVDGLTRIGEQIPDLVLLDITMPRMDGYEVCKQIRANPATANIPVVMISGKDGFFDKVRGRMAGTTGYITKPFGPETLMKALETYLVNEGQ